jgi:hypothetical protein
LNSRPLPGKDAVPFKAEFSLKVATFWMQILHLQGSKSRLAWSLDAFVSWPEEVLVRRVTLVRQ